MKERPILFSAPMVRALLDGSKMQTRRIVKMKQSEWCKEHRSELWSPNEIAEWRLQDGRWFGLQGWYTLAYADCPYGQIGDHLWVRESGWQRIKASGTFNAYYYSASISNKEREYLSSYPQSFKSRPSIHMPRWASRINLEITNVRVERLQDISVADAIAEGIKRTPVGKLITFEVPGTQIEKLGASAAYCALWETINGSGSWDLNPWVWVIEFKCNNSPVNKETL